MKLIIFDLDQTIIELFKFHNKTTTTTFKKIFGVKARLDEIDFVGNTIKKNLDTLAKLKGIKKSERNKEIPKAVKNYEKIFISIIPKNIKRFLLPGVHKLIKKLSQDKNNFLIILTGNSKLMTKTVLKRASILKDFHFLITGEHTKSRIKLIKKAVKKAKRKRKIDKIIVIGDSTHDIEAGRAVGAVTITVLTGFHSKAMLKKAKANYIFKNLNNKKILKIIEK